MCGISGIFGNHIDQKDLKYIKNMTTVNYNRGPDDCRILINKNVLLGFNRLSIIDLSQNAMQPFFNNSKTKAIIYNGEIYNFKKLKKELSDLYNFKTNSDTEVLLASYEIWGKSCFDKINGMFVFAIYDFIKKKIIIARDRFGQKPLYYHIDNKGKLYFSSELKSLSSLNFINFQLNKKILAEYLVEGNSDSGEETFYNNISQLNPGYYIEYDLNKKFVNKKWYNFKIPRIKKNLNEKKLKEILINSSIDHLISDVDLGLCLSGGLDSNAFLSLINKVDKDRFSKLKLYSVIYENDYSELDLINHSLKKFNKDLEIVNYTKKNFIDDYEKTVFMQDGPIGGLTNLGLGKLYSKAKQDKIKVLFDGTGLDECFGGYRVHHLLYLYQLKKLKKKNFLSEIQNFCYTWNQNELLVNKQIQSLSNLRFYNIDATSSLKDLCVNENFIKQNYFKRYPDRNLNKDINYHMFDFIVWSKIPRNCRMKDRLSMANSVELRMPFLEHKVVEYGLSLKSKYFFKEGYTKYPIRKTLKRIIHNKIRTTQKRDVQNPQTLWFKSPKVYEFINDIIKSKAFKETEFYNYKLVLNKLEDFKRGRYNNSFFMIQWLNTAFITSSKNNLVFIQDKLKKKINISFIHV